MAFLPLNELPALFPHVVDWISYLEKQAQESGRALTPMEFNLAQNVGVVHPEEVRVLSVPRIPLPAHPRVKQLARQVALLNADTGGLTAGYGVIVRRDCAKNLRLLAHEFVHVAQYERLGKVGFLQEYIKQIAADGYLNAPFEQEAEAEAIKACRGSGVHPFELSLILSKDARSPGPCADLPRPTRAYRLATSSAAVGSEKVEHSAARLRKHYLEVVDREEGYWAIRP
jgi:hypothetical protein